MRILNLTRNSIIATDIKIADTPITRLIGLLGRDCIIPEEALIITHCRQIHMFFMKFPIDVIFVNKQNHVVGLVKMIRPYRMSPYFIKANYVIELYLGAIEKSGTKIGDLIRIEGPKAEKV